MCTDVDLIVVSPHFAGQPFPQRLVFLRQHWTLPLFPEGLPDTPEEVERLRHSRGVVARALEEGIRIRA